MPCGIGARPGCTGIPFVGMGWGRREGGFPELTGEPMVMAFGSRTCTGEAGGEVRSPAASNFAVELLVAWTGEPTTDCCCCCCEG